MSQSRKRKREIMKNRVGNKNLQAEWEKWKKFEEQNKRNKEETKNGNK